LTASEKAAHTFSLLTISPRPVAARPLVYPHFVKAMGL